MPHTTPPPGAPCWFELTSTDVARSAAFYCDLFGWQKVDMDLGPMGVYSFLRNTNGTVGALCSPTPGHAGPSAWCVYFGVADADASTARARELGAEILAGPFDVAEHGRMATLRDPAGAGAYVIRLASS